MEMKTMTIDIKSKIPPNLEEVECCGTCKSSEHEEGEFYICEKYPISEEELKKHEIELEEIGYFGLVCGYQKCGKYEARK